MAMSRIFMSLLLLVCIIKLHVKGYPLAPLRIDTELSGTQERSFAIIDNRFHKDGQPFQIFSGELHYFRIPRA
eukprot:617225-Hanusia_phi.AAC.2